MTIWRITVAVHKDPRDAYRTRLLHLAWSRQVGISLEPIYPRALALPVQRLPSNDVRFTQRMTERFSHPGRGVQRTFRLEVQY